MARGVSCGAGQTESTRDAWAAFLDFAATPRPAALKVVSDYIQVGSYENEITCSRIVDIDQDDDSPVAIRVKLTMGFESSLSQEIADFEFEGPPGYDGGEYLSDDPSKPEARSTFQEVVCAVEQAALDMLMAAPCGVHIEAHDI